MHACKDRCYDATAFGCGTHCVALNIVLLCSSGQTPAQISAENQLHVMSKLTIKTHRVRLDPVRMSHVCDRQEQAMRRRPVQRCTAIFVSGHACINSSPHAMVHAQEDDLHTIEEGQEQEVSSETPQWPRRGSKPSSDDPYPSSISYYDTSGYNTSDYCGSSIYATTHTGQTSSGSSGDTAGTEAASKALALKVCSRLCKGHGSPC